MPEIGARWRNELEKHFRACQRTKPSQHLPKWHKSGWIITLDVFIGKHTLSLKKLINILTITIKRLTCT
jgi:methylphosphotriester-DNA--protein-cysteine methyltransferase